MSDMDHIWELIGEFQIAGQEFIGKPFEGNYYEQVIATFDEKQLAEQYIKDSKLKQRKSINYGSDKVFKSKSLLSGCVSARVEMAGIPDIPPHNPEI